VHSHIDSEIEEVTGNKFGGNEEEVSTVGGDSVNVNKIHGWEYFSWARLLEEKKELLLCCKRSSRPLGVAVPPLVGGLLLYFMNPTHEGKVKQSVVFFSSLCPLSASCSTSSIQLLTGTQLTTEFSPLIQVAKLGCICRLESLIFE
jgi:hypothetical protein